MTSVLTLRITPQQVARLDRRAAELGQDRSAYLRGLVEEDLRAAAAKPRRHVFASEDLVGCVDTGVKSGRRARLRKIIRERAVARYEANRRHRPA